MAPANLVRDTPDAPGCRVDRSTLDAITPVRQGATDGQSRSSVGRRMASPANPSAKGQPLLGCRVAVVGINFWPEHSGIGPYSTALAQALADDGADVTVVTGVPHYPQWRVDARYGRGLRWSERLGGIAVERVRHFVPRRAGLFGRALMEFTFLIGSLAVLLRRRPDVVIAVSPSLAAAGAAQLARRGSPLGLIVQDLVGNAAGESGTAGRQAARLIGTAERALLRRADLVGVIGDRFVEFVECEGVAPSRVRLLPNFTRVVGAESDRSAARRRLGWPSDTFTVVHTGNMGRKQGLDTVIEAARQSALTHPDTRFVLVGDGNQRQLLEAMAQHAPSVVLVDPVPDEEYADVLAAADVLLVCEKTGVKTMSLPSKITSYAASGTVIVAAVEQGGFTHRYLAEREMAVLARSGDPDDLLRALASVRANPGAVHPLVQRARHVAASELSADAARSRYQDFARELWGAPGDQAWMQ